MAGRDGATPLKVSIVAIGTNIALSLIFIFVLKLPIIWLAVAYSVGQILNSLGLLILLYRKVGGFDFKSFFTPPIKMGIITAITAISLYIPMKLLDQLVFDTTRTVGLILLTTIATLSGLTVYILLSWIFKVEQLVIFTHFLKRVMTWPSKLQSPPPTSIPSER